MRPKQDKRDKILYALRDAASDTYSASRIASLFMVLVDTAWMITAVLRLPAIEAYGPVSSMLAACTVAAFGAYGINSAVNSWRLAGEGIGTIFKKTTTVTDDEGEDKKTTTTMTSQVGRKPKPAPEGES